MRILLLVLLIVFTACQTKPPRHTSEPLKTYHKRVLEQSVSLQKAHFEIIYSSQYRNPVKVSYSLKREKLLAKNAKRRDRFYADPDLLARSLPAVKPSDYLRSGFDRGHMAPSEDFTWDQAINDETFVMSNMSPQRPALNRGSWAQLEHQIRRWACGEGELYIEVGPIIEQGLGQLPSGVAIPQRFYKVVLDRTPPIKSVGFVFTQEDGSGSFEARAMSVKEVERRTGDTFFDKYKESESIKGAFELKSWAEDDCQLKNKAKPTSKSRKRS